MNKIIPEKNLTIKKINLYSSERKPVSSADKPGKKENKKQERERVETGTSELKQINFA